jgi:hypothetical protein
LPSKVLELDGSEKALIIAMAKLEKENMDKLRDK